MNPIPDTALLVNNLRLDKLEAYEKMKYYDSTIGIQP